MNTRSNCRLPEETGLCRDPGRHPRRGTTTPTSTATANTVLGARPQQRDAQPPIPAQRSADVLPTQRQAHRTKRRLVATDTNTVIAQIKVAPNPHSVAFSGNSSRAYTANHESNLVSAIDNAALGVLATIPVGTSPHSIAISPDRPLVADVNYDANSVSVIDTNTLKVVATIPVGQHPQDIAWAPDGRFAYVVTDGSNTAFGDRRHDHPGHRDHPHWDRPDQHRGTAQRPPGLCEQPQQRTLTVLKLAD